MFIEIMGKYPPALPTILTHEEFGPTKSALDVGCGNGSWCVSYANIGRSWGLSLAECQGNTGCA
jgi:cyclopropane fatty-acyl-phospholipid synthase-like methyltransferase